MIKNGRPYTIENGSVDDELISTISLTDEERLLIKQWITDNIKPRKTILKHHTSYGMKHLLESDTGIYLTNNAFKDAMMLEGYNPVDPNELNWEYRISLKKDRKKYTKSDINIANTSISQSNVNSNGSSVDVTISQTDDLTQEFFEMFKGLDLYNKIKVMNYTRNLVNK